MSGSDIMFHIFFCYGSKASSHYCLSIASLNHSWNFSCLLISSKTVCIIVRKCFLRMIEVVLICMGSGSMCQWYILGSVGLESLLIFPMYFHVLLVMKNLISGMFSNWSLTLSFEIICSLIVCSHFMSRMYLIVKWWKTFRLLRFFLFKFHDADPSSRMFRALLHISSILLFCLHLVYIWRSVIVLQFVTMLSWFRLQFWHLLSGHLP